MTDAAPPGERPSSDPEAATERSAMARARGLAAPSIAGGHDPDPAAGKAEERFYGRLLLFMVGAIVAAGFILGILALLAHGGRAA